MNQPTSETFVPNSASFSNELSSVSSLVLSLGLACENGIGDGPLPAFVRPALLVAVAGKLLCDNHDDSVGLEERRNLRNFQVKNSLAIA